MNSETLRMPRAAWDAEARILETEFLAPVLLGGYVKLRIAGILCQLVAEDPGFEGWAILRPRSLSTARFVTPPTREQVSCYLALFPAIPLVVAGRRRGVWYAFSEEQAFSPLAVDGPVPVHLAGTIAPFQRVLARFDGSQFLRDPEPPRNDGDPATANGAALEAACRFARESSRVGPKDAPVPMSHVRFRVQGRDYRVRVSPPQGPPTAAGLCLHRNRSLFDEGSLSGIVRRMGSSNGGFLAPVEYDGAWS